MSEFAARPLAFPDERSLDEGHFSSTICVVDDDPWIRELLVTTLSSGGYRVRAAGSAEDALDIVRTTAVDCVLSDVKLPGMDGIELSRILSESHPGLPVVLVTAVSDVELARLAIQQGASDYITKPFNIDGIHIVVERNLERRRVEQQRAAEQDHSTRFKVIEALAAAIDAKQSYTAEHSRRVTALASLIGRDLQLTSTEMRLLEMAAQVHDVGKIGVPDVILNKPGDLSEDEWEIMRQHSAQGAAIVGQVPELASVAEIVRFHHERVDGSGYPDGLCGEAIPLLARVIAVADAFECMTSDRAYRAKMPVNQAVKRLEEGAGAQFDRTVVKVFVRQLDEGRVPEDLSGSI